MLLTQISERRELNAVFADLFDSDGNEVYLKRAECYATLGEAVPWLLVQKVARTRGEVAIGTFKNNAPLINPPQRESITFEAGDRVIVVSEDDREAVGDERGGDLEETMTDPAAVVAAPPPEPRAAPVPKATAPFGHSSTPLVGKQPATGTQRAVSEGPRVQGPSTAPRAPLPANPAKKV
jgi:hypothetical protein